MREIQLGEIENESERHSVEIENVGGAVENEDVVVDDYIEELGELDDIGGLYNIGDSDVDVDILNNGSGSAYDLNQNVGETGEGDCDEGVRDDEDDYDSDESYMAQSESKSSDGEESLEDDYEIHQGLEDSASDEDEGNLGLNNDGEPL